MMIKLNYNFIAKFFGKGRSIRYLKTTFKNTQTKTLHRSNQRFLIQFGKFPFLDYLAIPIPDNRNKENLCNTNYFSRM